MNFTVFNKVVLFEAEYFPVDKIIDFLFIGRFK
jgi:hypothetical protein